MNFIDTDFKTPMKMFDTRTRQLRVRIQNLQADLVVAQHPFTKAVIKQELNNAIDEYVGRKIQEGNRKTN